MTVYDNITDTIGNTPLVRLHRLTEGLEADVLVKVESFNPCLLYTSPSPRDS